MENSESVPDGRPQRFLFPLSPLKNYKPFKRIFPARSA